MPAPPPAGTAPPRPERYPPARRPLSAYPGTWYPVRTLPQRPPSRRYPIAPIFKYPPIPRPGSLARSPASRPTGPKPCPTRSPSPARSLHHPYHEPRQPRKPQAGFNECDFLPDLPGRVPFWLGPRVFAWGAWVPWCRAGWACSWCAAQRGGSGIIREDRALGVDRVPPGVPDPPGRPFPPRCLPDPGAGGGTGAGGESRSRQDRGSGAAGVAAASPAAAGRRPPDCDGAHGGSVVPGRPDVPPVTWPAPWSRLPGLVRRKPRMAAPADRARGDGSHRDHGLDHQAAY